MDNKTDSKHNELDHDDITISIESRPAAKAKKGQTIVKVKGKNQVERESIFEPRPLQYKDNANVTMFYTNIKNVNNTDQKTESNCCKLSCTIL